MKKIIPIIVIVLYSFDCLSQSNEKETQKVDKRYVHPKSKFISVSAGIAFTSTHTMDPNNFIKSGFVMMNNHYFPNINYEHGLGNNLFFETGYEFGRIGINLGRQMTEEDSWDEYTRFVIDHNKHLLHVGMGYRLIGKNNFHFLNFHAGVFSGFSNNKNSELDAMLESPATFTIEEAPTGLDYQIERIINDYSRFLIGSYIGVSHELRLSKEVRLVFRYNHRFGFNSLLSGTYVFSENLNFSENATFNVRGGGAFISAGLKILLPDEYNKNELY
ncbi:MAG: hypothetical protein JJT77_13525 [Crocinitomicaceae bacterium]|nr:hypothetical protein [Crocinitomicaceae bacterium]